MFCSISKKNWITSYLSLPTEDPIIDAFRNLGDGNLTEKDLVEDELPLETRPIEIFPWENENVNENFSCSFQQHIFLVCTSENG